MLSKYFLILRRHHNNNRRKILMPGQILTSPQNLVAIFNDCQNRLYKNSTTTLPQNYFSLSRAWRTEIRVREFYSYGTEDMLIALTSIVRDFTFNEVALFIHLIDILMFFVRQHLFRSRFILLSEGLAARIAQLLPAPQKHLKLGNYDGRCLGEMKQLTSL